MRTGIFGVAIGFLAAVGGWAQVVSNQSVAGKYFFRQVSLGMDGAGNLADARSVQGTITFDSSGNFTFSGQQVIGNTAATAASGRGTYSVDPAGFVTMDSPARSGDRENARFGPLGLVGASTESADNAYDLFIAIPAPSGTAPAFSGSYWTVNLEFPSGTAANARNAIFELTTSGANGFSNIAVSGHAANLNGGAPALQSISNGSFTAAADGTGTFSFGGASTASLLSGSKNFYLSADGSVFIAGSTATGSHDFTIGVKAISGASNSTWNGNGGQNFWGAGLRLAPGSPAPALDYAGAMAANGAGNATWTKRMKAFSQGNLDFTAANAYSLNADGSGALPGALQQMALGASGNAFVTSAIDANDPGAFEIGFGVRMPKVSGTGVFLNPQGVVNAASFAPAGNPIAPGEFIALFGSGLAKSSQQTTPPYPSQLNGVTVLINGNAAPLYFVSTGQINCIVPHGTKGPTATIVVQNGTAGSNTVTVPVAATAPGMFSSTQSGTGAGAIRHADFSLVDAAHPAAGGETVLLYLTGMGAVTPPIGDGVGSSGLENATAQATVLVGGIPGQVLYNGLAPGFPGLYQINVTLPALPPGASGSIPLAIATGNAYHDQVGIPIP